MAEVGAVVDRLRQPLHGGQVFGEALPSPVDARQHCFGRDVLDRGQTAREPLALLGTARRQREAAIAHDHGGDAVPAGAAAEPVPRDLRIHVRVAVDEARRDDQAVGVDRALGDRGHASDLDDAPAGDSHVAAVAGGTRAIDDRSVADQEIESHGATSYPR